MAGKLVKQQENNDISLPDEKVLEELVGKGDLSGLTPQQRVEYYVKVCESLGLNPLTRPLSYIEMKDKDKKTILTLYASRDCTEQLRKRYGISIQIVARQRDDVAGTYVVVARASTPAGRTDESSGVVAIAKPGGDWSKVPDGEGGFKNKFKADGTMQPITGDELANLLMKAETKAKRRVTLSICGLGWLDESEIHTVKGAKVISDDMIGAASLPPMMEVEELASQEDRKTLVGLTEQLGWAQEDATKWIEEKTGKKATSQLTKKEIESLIIECKLQLSGGQDQ